MAWFNGGYVDFFTENLKFSNGLMNNEKIDSTNSNEISLSLRQYLRQSPDGNQLFPQVTHLFLL